MAISKIRRKLIQNFLKERQTSETSWECCQSRFLSLSDMGRHVNQVHEPEITEKEKNELNKLKAMEEYQNNLLKLKQRRGEKVNMKHIKLIKRFIDLYILGLIRSYLC